MSQLNVDQIKNRAGTGPALEMLSGGNFAIDTDTFYIDTSNNRVGINTASPQYSLHVGNVFYILLPTTSIISLLVVQRKVFWCCISTLEWTELVSWR